MTAGIQTTGARSSRLGLRATPEQEVVLRRAAELAHKSLTDFILDSACLAAEQTLLDQRLFMVSGAQFQDLLDLLEQPENPMKDCATFSLAKRPGTPSDPAPPGAFGLTPSTGWLRLWQAGSERLAHALRTPSAKQRVG